jgi:hypothetical protein
MYFMTWQGTCGAWFSIICWSVASVAFCQNDPVFRSEARFVTVDVQVLSHNRPIIGLLPKDRAAAFDAIATSAAQTASAF